MGAAQEGAAPTQTPLPSLPAAPHWPGGPPQALGSTEFEKQKIKRRLSPNSSLFLCLFFFLLLLFSMSFLLRKPLFAVSWTGEIFSLLLWWDVHTSPSRRRGIGIDLFYNPSPTDGQCASTSVFLCALDRKCLILWAGTQRGWLWGVPQEFPGGINSPNILGAPSGHGLLVMAFQMQTEG